MKPVTFAVIGCGHMGALAEDRAQKWETARLCLPLSHAAAIRAVPEARLAALCDVNPEAVRRAVERHPGATGYVSVEEMLAKERPDVVTIATRMRERPLLIEQCMAAGCRGLYVEKPLSSTLEQADAIAAAVRARDVAFIYGTQRRHAKSYRLAREAVTGGAFGRLQSVHLHLGNGPLFWTQPHAVDLALYLTGDGAVEHVEAELDLAPAGVTGRTVDPDPAVRYAHIRFRNGTSAFILPAASSDVNLCLERGELTVRDDGLRIETRVAQDSTIFTDGLLTRSTSIEPVQAVSPTVAAMTLLAQAVRDGKSLPGGVEQAVTNQEILFGIVMSHLRGSARVAWPLPREGWTMLARTNQRFA